MAMTRRSLTLLSKYKIQHMASASWLWTMSEYLVACIHCEGGSVQGHELECPLAPD